MSRHTLPLALLSVRHRGARRRQTYAPQIYSRQVEAPPQAGALRRRAAPPDGRRLHRVHLQRNGEAPRGAGRRYQVPQYIDRDQGRYQEVEPQLAPRGSALRLSAAGRADAEPARPALDPRFLPQVVAYDGKHAPGTIVVDTPNKFLYLVEEGGRAKRYGIGVGRPGFTWAGMKSITRKAEWPDWVPPPEMLQRRPDLPRHMAGGPDNPLGARAMYLGSSLYRIHGSNEPWTIGTAVSSGCIRMRNEDVIDLYSRVRVGTKVVVI